MKIDFKLKEVLDVWKDDGKYDFLFVRFLADNDNIYTVAFERKSDEWDLFDLNEDFSGQITAQTHYFRKNLAFRKANSNQIQQPLKSSDKLDVKLILLTPDEVQKRKEAKNELAQSLLNHEKVRLHTLF